ncbi:hypothetical protein M404DRAFT_34625 [Pisolithus tinctorius Marx 270]|uniref:Uncharacterized protein n=1 Tax=Pisolithus tinctorius Marx 270 TaxID=870435 RepID=A0A0C3JB31_PISTI|nr:hypothetical protein M404DRAFT_34625 [Pisolithus tinctorius Marx 270]
MSIRNSTVVSPQPPPRHVAGKSHRSSVKTPVTSLALLLRTFLRNAGTPLRLWSLSFVHSTSALETKRKDLSGPTIRVTCESKEF